MHLELLLLPSGELRSAPPGPVFGWSSLSHVSRRRVRVVFESDPPVRPGLLRA
jgi:hypothetical protein